MNKIIATYLPTYKTLAVSKRFGGSIPIGKWLFIILGPFNSSVQTTESMSILVISSKTPSGGGIGASCDSLDDNIAEISKKGLLRNKCFADSLSSSPSPFAINRENALVYFNF